MSVSVRVRVRAGIRARVRVGVTSVMSRFRQLSKVGPFLNNVVRNSLRQPRDGNVSIGLFENIQGN